MSQKSVLSLLIEKVKCANRRVLFAMVSYLALIGVALFVLLPVKTQEERYLLGFVLFIFCLLIFKTLIHARKGDL
jgi:hypothetical protein